MNVLVIMIQSFVSMGWTTVIWYIYGHSLCFSGDWHGVVGNLNNTFLRGIDLNTPSPNNTIPMLVFIAYQMMFAIITPALISGAFTNRVTFKTYMLFLTGWLTFVYFPFVHMVWGGGFLQQWGVKDFAGVIVVHIIAGMAALASVLYVGKRRALDRGPHSIPLVALGTGLLWFGWYGFNEKKPKFLGLLTGAVAGLATVTAAAGYVSPTTAVIIGIVSGVVCYCAVELKNRLHWDDALDVWGVHGVGGLLGIIMLGIFSTKQFNPDASKGLLYGNPSFFLKQLTAVVFSSVWAFAFTYAMLRIIDVFTPVKVTELTEEIGLDESQLGEHAYEQMAD